MDVFDYYGIIFKPNPTNLTLRTKLLHCFAYVLRLKQNTYLYGLYCNRVHGVHKHSEHTADVIRDQGKRQRQIGFGDRKIHV